MLKRRAPIVPLLVGVLVLFGLLSATSCSTQSESLPTLIFFRSSTCPYCKEMTPVVDEIGTAYRGELKVVIATLEEEKGRDLADQYGIVGFPVILLLDREGERVSRMQGVVPRPSLEQAVEELIRPKQ
jgi:thioredoxin-like negative regulator of GroEL